MKLKTIELNNFLQFYQTKIELDDNVNFLIGDNTTGKSTLMASMIFTLFGSKSLINSKLLRDIKKEEQIRNIKHKDEDVRVTIVFNADNGDTYTANRVLKRSGNEFGELYLKSAAKGGRRELVEFSEITEILPEFLAPLLFFNGEKIGAFEKIMGGSNINDEFKDNIERVMRVDKLTAMKTLIQKASRIAQKSFNTELPEQRTKEAELEALIAKKKEQEEAIAIVNKNLKKCSDEELEISEFLMKHEETRKLEQEYQLKLAEIKSCNIQLEKEESEAKRMLGNQGYTTFKLRIFSDVYDQLEQEEEEAVDEISISGIHQDAIDAIIEHEKCICGEILSEEQIKHLKSLKKFLPPENYKNDIKRRRNAVDNDYTEVMESKKQAIAGLKHELIKLNNARLDLKKELSDFDVTDIKEKSKRRDYLIKEIGTQEEKLQILTDQVEKKEQKIAKYNIELVNIAKSAHEHNKNVRVYEELKLAEAELVKHIKETREEKREHLQKYINRNINELLRDKAFVELDSNMKPKVSYQNGTDSSSTAQRAAMSIAYLFALIDLAKEIIKEDSEQLEWIDQETWESYPLVFDGVSSSLDPEHTGNLMDKIQNYEGQIIMLMNPGQYEQISSNYKGTSVNQKIFRPKDSSYSTIGE